MRLRDTSNVSLRYHISIVEGIRRRKFTVALDCVRGAGAAIMPALLEELGCKVVAINTETDGRFPRPPEPVAENLGELERLVLDSTADVGFAVDPDVDRLAWCPNEGKAIGEDFTLALAARLVLRHRRGPVVTNLSTSRVVEDVATAAGVPVIRAPVGEVNVAVRMREEKAPIGGEGNGGVILSEVHLGRDAPVGAALLLQLLHEENRPLSRIVAELPRYVIVKDKLDRPNARPRPGVRCPAVGDARRGGGHAGRAATVVAGPLGTCSAVGNGADRASHRRGAVARGRGRARRSFADAARRAERETLSQDEHLCAESSDTSDRRGRRRS